jgi:nucleotide-binding universal stress UspA family protein
MLVGYDGSPQSEKAVEVAFSLADCIDSTVLIFAVARPPEPATSVELEAVLDDAKEHYQEGFKNCMLHSQNWSSIHMHFFMCWKAQS